MEYLLNPRNINILESFTLVKTLFAFDYDGTLAPITDDPQSAHMKPAVSKLLEELNHLSPIAIITGRKVGDVQKLLPFAPSVIIGNHGAEGLQSPSEMESMKEDVRLWLEGLKDLKPIMDKLGIKIENKEYSLSFHYRNASSPEIAESALDMMLMDLPRSRKTRGKFVLNVVPENSFHKGMALDRVMKQNKYPFGVYFGDDQTDEDVFRYHNPKLLTVKVGPGKSSAKYFLHEQDEMADVLKLLKQFFLKAKVTPGF